MNDKIAVWEAQKKLAGLWFTICGTLFLILVAQTIAGKYGNQPTIIWSWFCHYVLPSLSLILAAVAYDYINRQANVYVPTLIYRFAFWLSLIYTITILLTVVLQPISPMEPKILLASSRIYLDVIQSLVGGVLGIFFVARR